MKPEIVERKHDPEVEKAAIALGLSPVAAKVVSARLSDAGALQQTLYADLKALADPTGLHDVERAATRIADAMEAGEQIGLCVDHDADGTTAGAVLYSALVEKFGYDGHKLQFYISHRRLQGYGLNASLADEIIADENRPSLLITADCGSSDDKQIARLAPETDCIVSDHHAMPVEGPPGGAFAVVSPIHPDSNYDPHIAGCMTAWLLMAQLRRVLIERGKLPADAPHLQDELAFVAIGSQADCVSLASPINRAVIRYGLARMNRDDLPCWVAARDMLLKDGERFTSEFLGFQLAPRIGAPGRLDRSHPGLKFLLAPDLDSAREALQVLDEANTARKAVQREIAAKAEPIAREQVESEKVAIAVYLPDGHVGVHGIVASRLKDRYGRPTVMIAPRDGNPDIAGCSFRSVEGVHIREALQHVQDNHPDLLVGFGGHRMAAGASVPVDRIPEFSEAFEVAVREQMDLADAGPVIEVDAVADPGEIDLSLVDDLVGMDPFGTGFETCKVVVEGQLDRTRWVGSNAEHLQFTVQGEKGSVRGVWFFADEMLDPESELDGRAAKVVCQPTENIWNGNRSVQVIANFISLHD